MKKLLLLALLQAGGHLSPGVEAGNSSTKQVAKKVAASGAVAPLRPGRWESTVRIIDIEVPGTPPEAAARMKELAKGKVFAQCLTPKEARKPAPDFFVRSKDCRYERFSMANGRLDAKMRCNRGAMTLDATMAGQFWQDSFQMTMTMTIKSAGVQTMTLKMDARRTGKCTGTEKS